MEDASSNAMLWELEEWNDYGLIEKYKLGNGISTSLAYDDYFRSERFYTNNILRWDYEWNSLNGNLTLRKRSNGSGVGAEETFSYDNLERLTAQQLTDVQQNTISTGNTQYSSLGLITSKSDAGLDYRYNQQKQLRKVQEPQPALNTAEQTITFNANKLPLSIEEGAYELNYLYGPDQSRIKGVWKQNAQVYRTRRYATGIEENEELRNGVVTTHKITYLSSPTGLCLP